MPFFAASDGARLHYRDQGHGPVIVFLHGWMMSSRLWDRQFASLAKERRLVAPDLRGCGDSEALPGTHRMDRLADDVADLLKTLDLREVTLVGWSMGGGLLMRYLDRHGPSRVARVALIDFPPHFQEDPAVTEKVRSRLRTDRRGFLEPFLKRMFHGPLDPADADLIWKENAKCQTETACEIYGELGVGDARAQRWDLPAMLVFPDRGWYAASLGEWKRIFPTHTAPRFSASRHAPFWEEAQTFNQALETFTSG